MGLITGRDHAKHSASEWTQTCTATPQAQWHCVTFVTTMRLLQEQCFCKCFVFVEAKLVRDYSLATGLIQPQS